MRMVGNGLRSASPLNRTRKTAIAILRPNIFCWRWRFASRRYENIKRGVRQSQQVSVLLAGPTGVLNRYTLISMFRQKIHERTRRTLIAQDLHQRPETRLRQASSNAATASSRLTIGYCFKNRSSVSPPSKSSSTALNGTRVPAKYWLTAHDFGSLTTTLAIARSLTTHSCLSLFPAPVL
jgi:hypothetical protein